MRRIMPVTFTILIGLFTLAASCQVGGTKEIGFRGYAIAHTSAMLTKTVEADLVCGRVTAPAPPLCVDDATHGKILEILREVFVLDADLGRLIQSLPEGTPTTPEVGYMIGNVTVLIGDAVKLIPKSPQRQALAEKVAPAVK